MGVCFIAGHLTKTLVLPVSAASGIDDYRILSDVRCVVGRTLLGRPPGSYLSQPAFRHARDRPILRGIQSGEVMCLTLRRSFGISK